MLVTVMAVACGAAVANLYYAQPLLDTLARHFEVSTGTAGLIVTLTQFGYVAGLVFIVPLGDLLERRRLIAIVSLGTAVALAWAGISPSIMPFLAASLAVGATAVVTQILVPLAANLANDAQRGAVVGRVMSGLLIGVLLARAVSGLVADALGWRAVYWLAATVMLVQTGILHRMLPRSRNVTRLNYLALLVSVWHLVREEPLLRRRIVYGVLGFGAFSVLWTAIAFLLARPPYNFSDTVIGLFGLLGAGGAICAAFAGHLHDRGLTEISTGVFISLMVVSFALMGLASHHVAAIIAGVVLLDIGQQGTHILNQSVIYALRPEARSRITTAYMASFFFGGVVGSASSAYVFGFAGWTGICWLGGTFGALAFAYWLLRDRARPRAEAMPLRPECPDPGRALGRDDPGERRTKFG